MLHDVLIDDLFIAADEYAEREAALQFDQFVQDMASDDEATAWYAARDLESIAHQDAAYSREGV